MIEIRWDGKGRPLLALYRARVGKPKYVWFRANIIKTTDASVSSPTTTPDQVKEQVAYNNVMLWQAGIKLVPDPDPTPYNGAKKEKDHEGIFTIESATNYTCNVTDAPSIVAPILNQRSGVFNVAYIHTVKNKPTLNGKATDRRKSAETDGEVPLGGSPSTSWVQPTGVYPDADGDVITMKTMATSNGRNAAAEELAGDKQIDNVCGCIMTQKAATARKHHARPRTRTRPRLHHRGCGGDEVPHSTDGVNHLAGPSKIAGHPWIENVMTTARTPTGGLDLVQTQVMRQHALLKDWPRSRPGRPPSCRPR